MGLLSVTPLGGCFLDKEGLHYYYYLRNAELTPWTLVCSTLTAMRFLFLPAHLTRGVNSLEARFYTLQVGLRGPAPPLPEDVGRWWGSVPSFL